jgi:hypothetical protein
MTLLMSMSMWTIWQYEQTANQKVHAITCSYFCLNIFSVLLCNISVNQQSFLKSKYLVSIRTNMRAIPAVKSLLFYHHVSYRKHLSVDRTLQEVNIYEQRKYEVQHLLKKKCLDSWNLRLVNCYYKYTK